MYHPQTGYSESVLSSLGLSGGVRDQDTEQQPLGQSTLMQSLGASGDGWTASTGVSLLPEPVFLVSPTKQQPQQAHTNSQSRLLADDSRPATAANPALSTPYKPPQGAQHMLSPHVAHPMQPLGDSSRHSDPPSNPTANLTACAFVLFLVGCPGSGKSTIAQRLVNELGFRHLDVHLLLNAEIKVGSNTGRLISDFLKLGKPVPGEIVAELLRHHISTGLAEASSMSSSGGLSTFFVVEHFPEDAVAWKAWQKHMASGMAKVMRYETGKGKAGGGLATAIELRAPLSVCMDRLARRGNAGDEQATVERRMKHYESTLSPLLADISRFSLAILGKVQTQTTLDSVWSEVRNLVAALITRISLTPPLPSSLVPIPLSDTAARRARRRIFPVFMLGGPGAGRSHLCRRLSQEFGFIHLNFDEVVLRASVEQEPNSLGGVAAPLPGALAHLSQTPQQLMAALMAITTTGNETERAVRVSTLLKEGRPLPTELALELILEPLHAHLASGHTLFLFDGFPHAPDQWSGLMSALWGVDPQSNPELAATMQNYVTGFYLECPERIRHSRLLRRRSPKDSPRTIEARMRLYESLTLPLEVQLMNSSPHTLYRIQASLSEGEVFREVAKRLVMSVVDNLALADQPLTPQPDNRLGMLLRNSQHTTKADRGEVVYRLGGTNSALDAALTASSSSDLTVVDTRRSLARLIFLFGPPGSGVSSVATQTCMDYEVVQIDLDQLVTKAIANRSTHRAAILQHLQMQQPGGGQNGSAAAADASLLPSYIALDLLSQALAANMKAGSSFFLVSGFPASRAHFEAFEQHMLHNVQVVKCLYLDTSAGLTCGPASSAVAAASGNRSHAHSKDAAPPAANGIQDDQRVCMERLTARGDHFDDINMRLKVYNTNTKPLLESFCQPTPPPTVATGGSTMHKKATPPTPVAKKPDAGVIGTMCGAPIYQVHAGSKVTKQMLYDQVTHYFADLAYLLLPASAKKQVSKSVVFVLFVMGGLGSGRTTITQRILHDYDFVHLEIDTLLNEEIEQGTQDGMVLQQIFLHGGALPSETVASILKRHISRHISHSKKTHFLVSGFPIDEMGWAAWVEVMGSAAEIPTAIYLDCPEEIRRERCLARGDDETSIRQAFAFFNERTVPLIDALTAKGTVLTISSMEAIDQVYGRVQNELEILLHSLRAPVNHSNLGSTGSRAAILSSTQPIGQDGQLVTKIDPLAASQQLIGRGKLPQLLSDTSSEDTESKTYLLGQRSQHGDLADEFGLGATAGQQGSHGSFPSNYTTMRYNLLFVFASPGAGASTQLRRLRSQYLDPSSAGASGFVNLHYVSMEELVFAAMESGTPLGRTIGAHLKASLQALDNTADGEPAAIMARLGQKNGADNLSSVRPLTLISSSLLAQLLKQHLESLLLAQEDAEYQARIRASNSGTASASSLAASTGRHILSKVNVLVEGFPTDERGWEELLQALSEAGASDLRHQLYLDAPEPLRVDRLRKSGLVSLSEIHARCNEFNARLLPLIKKLGASGGADLQPSLYHVSTTPSADIVQLQLLNALHTKFGVYAPVAAVGRTNDGMWRHPYGLRRCGDAAAAATADSALVPAASSSALVSNQSRPIFVLFLFGPPGSGRQTLASSLTSAGPAGGRDFEVRSWGFLELDVLKLAQDEVDQRADSRLAEKIKAHWAERNATLLKDPATLTRDAHSADARSLLLPKEVSVGLLLAALHFHTKNLYNFAFLIRNFPQDADTWKEWESITSHSPAHGGDGSATTTASIGSHNPYGSEFAPLDRKLKPMGLWIDAPSSMKETRETRLRLGVGMSSAQVAQAEFLWDIFTRPLVESLAAAPRTNIVKLDGSVSEAKVLEQAKEAVRTLLATAERSHPSQPIGVEEIQKLSADQRNRPLLQFVSGSSGAAGGTSATPAQLQQDRIPNKVIFVVGSPGSGRTTFCRHLCSRPFSLNPRNPHEPLVRFEHIDVEQLYRQYLAQHPSARLEKELNATGGETSRFSQPRNVQLTVYLLRQAILAVAPSAAAKQLLAVLGPSAEEDDEDEALDDMDVEDEQSSKAAAADSLQQSKETTLFVISGFPRDAPEFAAWQEEIESSSLARLLLVVHLDVDLMTSTKRLLARGDRQDVVKQDLNVYTYRTVPLLESLINSASSQPGGFQVLTIHAAAPLDDVLDEAVIQLRKRNSVAAAVEAEQVRLAAVGDRRTQLAIKRKHALLTKPIGNLGMVGSNSTVYQLGEKQSYLLEIQSLLSQLPATGSTVILMNFFLGPPGAGIASHAARAAKGHHHLASIHLDSLLAAEVASGSRRGVLIANATAEKKPVSKWLRIILLLQQVLALARGHVASERAASEEKSTSQSFIPSDSGAVSVAARDAAVEPLPVLVAGFPATQGEWNGWKKVLSLLSQPGSQLTPCIRNLAFLLPDVDNDACIARLLRSGHSTLSIDARLAAYKARTAPFIQSEFGRPGRVVRIQGNSALPPWNESTRVLQETLGVEAVPADGGPLAFSFDARPREQEVYDSVCAFVRLYLARAPLAEGLARFEDRATEEAVYTVGKPLDVRPQMRFFFLLGAPGAGVRTYLERIRAKYDFEVVDLAVLIAKELQKRGAAVTADTRAVAQAVQHHLLLPAELAVRLLLSAVLARNALGTSQFLVANFPQTKGQWDLFSTHAEMVPTRAVISKILFLDTPEAERLTRMHAQLGSGAIGLDGHLKVASSPEDVEVRVANYNLQTKKVMSELLARGVLSRISTKAIPASLVSTDVNGIPVELDVLPVSQQISQIFKKICDEHIDPTWKFLRREDDEAEEQTQKRLDQTLLALPGEKRGQREMNGAVTHISLGDQTQQTPRPPTRITAVGDGEEKSYEVGLAQMSPSPRYSPQPPQTKNPFSVAGGQAFSTPLQREMALAGGGMSSPRAPGKLKESHTLFVLFLVGGPGSGRRTMAARMEQTHPNYVDVSLQTLEADEIARGTEAGKNILSARQYGRLPPPSISLLLLNRALKHAAVQQKRLAIVHGFPEDIEAWRAWTNAYGDALPALIYLVAPENVREARLLNENVPLYQIKTQQSMFTNYTVPLLELLEKRSPGSVTRVSALSNREKVYEQVNQAIQTYLQGLEAEVHTDAATRAAMKAHAEQIAAEQAAAAVAAAGAPSPWLKQFPSVEAKAARSSLEGEYLHVSLSAKDLDKPDFFSTANPYFEFNRWVPEQTSGRPTNIVVQRDEEKTAMSPTAGGVSTLPGRGRWEKIYQSPVSFNTLNPTWNAFLLDNDYLTSRHLHAPVLCVLWSWTKGEQPKFMCSVQTTVREMMEAAQSGQSLTLNKVVRLGDHGESVQGGHGFFSANKNAPAGSLRIQLCKRLIYRPLEEVLQNAPRPPSAIRQDRDALMPVGTTNNNVVAIPIVGSLAATNSTAGLSLPPTFANISATALLGAKRAYEESDCVVRLSLIGEYLESKGWTSASKPFATRDQFAVVPSSGVGVNTLQSLTAGNAASGGGNKVKCDPYVDIYGLDREPLTRRPFWKLAYSTEVLENTRSPKWNIFVLRLWSLCANDYYRPILLKVWDHSTFGSPEFIGEVQTNLKEILVKSQGQARFDLIHPTRARNVITNQSAFGAQTAAYHPPAGLSSPSAGLAAPYESVGSLVFSYARVFSDVKFSQIERSGNGIPADIRQVVEKKPVQ